MEWRLKSALKPIDANLVGDFEAFKRQSHLKQVQFKQRCNNNNNNVSIFGHSFMSAITATFVFSVYEASITAPIQIVAKFGIDKRIATDLEHKVTEMMNDNIRQLRWFYVGAKLYSIQVISFTQCF